MNYRNAGTIACIHQHNALLAICQALDVGGRLSGNGQKEELAKGLWVSSIGLFGVVVSFLQCLLDTLFLVEIKREENQKSCEGEKSVFRFGQNKNDVYVNKFFEESVQT